MWRSITARHGWTRKTAAQLVRIPRRGRLVIDRTGLTGGFDMDMEWAPNERAERPTPD
jgi:uncharacterized protein (TIGR03435 family)